MAWHIGQRVLARCELRPSPSQKPAQLLLLLHTGPPLCVCHLCYKYQYFTKSCIHSPPDCLNKQTCHFTLVPLHFHRTWTPSSKRSPQVSLIFYARFLDWVGFIIGNEDAFLERILTHCETLQVGAIFVDNMQIFSPPTFFFHFLLLATARFLQ